MSSLQDIGVRVETGWGNLDPVLHEIRHALEELVEQGSTRIIDLRSLPFSSEEIRRLEEQLGRGEVHAGIDALGPSEYVETRYPGVWLTTHRNADNEVIARFIEITRIPELLLAQDADVRGGLDRLTEELDSRNEPH